VCVCFICEGGQISTVSLPMQRKLFIVLTCQLMEEEGQVKIMRAARSLGERAVTELLLLHQNPQQLAPSLWAAVRNRGCQFLGPGQYHENHTTHWNILIVTVIVCTLAVCCEQLCRRRC
jgi:hypothetical protein